MPAAAQLPSQRWDFEIMRGPVSENGDLRFDGDSGRILLEHDDRAYQPLRELRIGGGRISFVLARRRQRFEGTITDTLMSGTMRDDRGSPWPWRALPLPGLSTLWPVPPRVTVRQFVLGNAARTERIPGAWIAALPPTSRVDADVLAAERRAGLPPVAAGERDQRSEGLMLGLDSAGRRIERAIIGRIAATGIDAPVFRSIFGSPPGWRTDIYDVLPGEAAHYVSYSFTLSHAARGLVAIGELRPRADTAAIRYGIWQLWARTAGDTAALERRLAPLAGTDPEAAASVRAAVAGFDDAVAWWRRAVQWLLTHPWMETPDGPRSPAQLVAAFWGVDTLPLPEIAIAHAGRADAAPVVAVWRLGRVLLRGENASGEDWLAHGGVGPAFAAWLPLRWGEVPLIVSVAGRPEAVMSPAAEAEAHPAGFFGPNDAVRIDPGITPLAAIPVIVHEWQHLVMAQRRLAGDHPRALTATPGEVRLHDDDPWLAEGFAEWATDEILRSPDSAGAWMRLTQAEKRLAIAGRDSLDPHVLGYRMIRAAAAHVGVTTLRDRLVAFLDDAGRMAASVGLAGPGPGRHAPLLLDRPGTITVLPEITFTWEDGAVSGLTRRLNLPATHPEP